MNLPEVIADTMASLDFPEVIWLTNLRGTRDGKPGPRICDMRAAVWYRARFYKYPGNNYPSYPEIAGATCTTSHSVVWEGVHRFGIALKCPTYSGRMLPVVEKYRKAYPSNVKKEVHNG
jgi:hypothetical protein